MDHSYVQTLVNKGELTEEQAQSHPKSNILMGCLGTDTDPPVDQHLIPKLRPGDVLMACSDGVWHYFTTEELGSILASLSAREATEFLIEKARSRARGGGDNLSLVIVKARNTGLSGRALVAPARMAGTQSRQRGVYHAVFERPEIPWTAFHASGIPYAGIRATSVLRCRALQAPLRLTSVT